MPGKIEHRDIASGKLARVFTGSTPYNVFTRGGENPAGNGSPCRAIVAIGAVVIVGTDGTTVSLPDLGNFQWNLQAKSITSGNGVVIY